MTKKEVLEGKWPPALSRNHPTLSAEEQARLLDAAAAVVGLGGLGGYLSTLLARAGVGRLVLVDGDLYDPTNVNRQILATTETMGKSKAEVTAAWCRSINPSMQITAVEDHFRAEDSEQILKGVDVVMDGLDSIPARRELFKATRAANLPYIHGAVTGYVGQTSTFLPQSPLHLNHVYPAADLPASPSLSVLAPTVAVIAGIQALEAIRLLCGHEPANAGILVFFDGTETSFHKIPLRTPAR